MADIGVALRAWPGALADFGDALGAAGVTLEGGGVFTTGGAGVAHFLVADGGRARSALERAGIGPVDVSPIVMLRLDQERPGQLGAFCRRLGDAGIDILVQYSDHDHRLVVIVSPDQHAECAGIAAEWDVDRHATPARGTQVSTGGPMPNRPDRDHRPPDASGAPPFAAAHRSFTHRIRVDLPAAEALDLFTPLGEREWIAEWDPTFLHPADGETRPGLVFTSGDGAELTFWTVADFDRATGRARYMRVTPASRSVIVEVKVTPIDAQACEVEVGYALTALTAAGNDTIVAMTTSTYAEMIDGWAELIAGHLADRRTRR